MVGVDFVRKNVWCHTPTFYVLLGEDPKSVDEEFIHKLRPVPAPDGSTHWVLQVRERFTRCRRSTATTGWRIS